MKKTIAIGLMLLFGACSLDIPDLNNPSIDDLETNPTRPKFASAAIGLLIGNRVDYAEANGYISILGILGRESYNFDTADPRYISELLAGTNLDAGSPRFGGNFWSVPYRNIRNANVILNALDVDEAKEAPLFSAEERSALRGYAKTIQALDFLTIINTRDEHGAAVDVNRPLDAELPPIVSKAKVFEHIASLLDEGRGDLMAAGLNGFPFGLPSGFAGTDTFSGFAAPGTFVLFNRAIKARAAVYMGDYAAAEAALSESFLTADPGNPQLDRGVYHSYGTGNGDRQNGLVDPNIFAHPSIMEDAAVKGDGGLDNRAVQKIFLKDLPRKVQDLESQYGFARYQAPQNPSASVPIIRNEELILLRAEVRMAQGDVTGAAEDLNFIRVHSGGLDERNDLTADNLEDELLAQRRYSLLFEGGHRWIDLRRFGRLAELPLDGEGHKVHASFPLPVQETDPR